MPTDRKFPNLKGPKTEGHRIMCDGRHALQAKLMVVDELSLSTWCMHEYTDNRSSDIGGDLLILL